MKLDNLIIARIFKESAISAVTVDPRQTLQLIFSQKRRRVWLESIAGFRHDFQGCRGFRRKVLLRQSKLELDYQSCGRCFIVVVAVNHSM